MKCILYTATLCLTGLIAPTLSVYAQAPAVEKKANQATAQLTIKALKHLQNAFASAATARDKASAEKAVAIINKELEKIDALTPLLAKAAKPTDAEMELVAEASAKMEVDMHQQLEIIARNLKDREVKRLIDPAMKLFAEKSSKIKASMDSLYPAAKMRPLVKAATARIKLQNSTR